MDAPELRNVFKKSDKLSLVAYYDDIVRKNAKILNSARVWCRLSLDLASGMKNSQVKHAEDAVNIKRLEGECHRLEVLNRNTIDLYEEEVRMRHAVEKSRHKLEEQLDVIRQVLQDRDYLSDQDRQRLAFLNTGRTSLRQKRDHSAGSLLDPKEISFDSTDDNLDGSNLRSGRVFRRSSRPDSTGRRRSTSQAHLVGPGVVTTTTRVHVGDSPTRTRTVVNTAVQPSAPPAEPARKRRSEDSQDSYFGIENKRLAVDPTGDSDPQNDGIHRAYLLSGQQTNTNRAIDTPDISPCGPSRTPSCSRLTRAHQFWTKTIIKSESCSVCGKKITFGKSALKCNHCKSTVHSVCRDKLIAPCVMIGTPASVGCSVSSLTGNHSHGRSNTVLLSDYCPVNDAPKVPALIIHCIKEIEARGLKEKGIYRIPGSEKQIKDLYSKLLRGKIPPSLGQIDDIHVVCGCLKLFLRNLTEPIVTYDKWPVLARAAASKNQEEGQTILRRVMDDLPIPNRDSLAYTMLHLQLVVNSPVCCMGADNLSKVFGPTLVGNSKSDLDVIGAVSETRDQQAIILLFLSMSRDYYASILRESEVSCARYFSPLPASTPLRCRVPKTPASACRSANQKKFFPSVLLHRDEENEQL